MVLLSQPGQLSAIDCIREVKSTLLVDPAGQQPNTINPDLVMHVLRKQGKIT